VSCLAIDVGNTSTALGIVQGQRVRDVHHIQGGIRNAARVRSILRALRDPDALEGAILGSVVPDVNGAWIHMLKAELGLDTLIVRHTLKLGVPVTYPAPETIGADRLANASQAAARFGMPVIVADFGTALTFDVIVPERGYIGGVIAPGLPLMTTYMAEKTALLPLIDLRGRCRPVGRSTEDAMRIGARVGYRGMVREIVAYLETHNSMPGAALCATGGYARWALAGIGLPFTIAPNLTLRGLSRIFALNR